MLGAPNSSFLSTSAPLPVLLGSAIGLTQVGCVHCSHPEILDQVLILDGYSPDDAPLITYVSRWPGQEAAMYLEQVPSALVYSNTGEVREPSFTGADKALTYFF